MKQINGEGNQMRIMEYKHESGNKAKNKAIGGVGYVIR